MQLWQKVMLGLMAGILLGSLFNSDSYFLNIAYIIGNMFMRSIKMVMGPLIFCALTKGIVTAPSTQALGRVGKKILFISIITTIFAVIFGLVMGWLVQPGKGVVIIPDATYVLEKKTFSVVNFILEIVPDNLFKAFYKGNLIQIVFFSIFTGIIISRLKVYSSHLRNAVSVLSKIVFSMTNTILQFSPYGAGALIACTVGYEGIAVLFNLTKLILAITTAMLLQYIIFGIMIFVFCKKSPIPFYRKSMPYQLLAFSTSSSKAVLPTTMKVCTENLGVSESSANVILPISASLNMNGSAIGLGLSAIFCAQVHSITLCWQDYLAIIFTSTVGAIGGAGVPGAGLVMLPMVLQSVNIPLDTIAMITGIDRLLDMLRTTINVTGDVTMTIIIDHTEGYWNHKKYFSKS